MFMKCSYSSVELDSLVLDSMDEPFYLVAPDFNLLKANASLAKLFGLSKQCRRGQPCFRVLRQRATPCTACAAQSALRRARSITTMQRIAVGPHDELWAAVRAYPVFDAKRRIVAVALILRHMAKTRARLERGRLWSDPTAMDDSQFGPGQSASRKDNAYQIQPLSPREKQVLHLVTLGCTNADISSMLSISAHTVKSHITHIFNKLGVNHRAQAAVVAVRHHLV